MGWIAAAFFAALAVGAIVALRRTHQRRLQEIQASQRSSLQESQQEYHRSLDRLRRESEDRLRHAHHPLAQDLLPALDSLHLAQKQAADAGLDEFQQGLKAAVDDLERALSRHGVEAIAPESGDAFDPAFHQAIARREEPQVTTTSIGALHRRGYRDGDRILRPALVEVLTAPQLDSPDEPEESDEPDEPTESTSDPDGSFSVGSDARSASNDPSSGSVP